MGWSDKVRRHAVWNCLQSLGPALDEAKAIDDLSPSSIELLERVAALLAFIGKRLAAADPLLIPLPNLDILNSHLSMADDQVRKFTETSLEEHLNTANDQASAAAIIVSSLPIPINVDDLVTIGEATAAYRTALDKYLQDADKTVAEALGRVRASIDEMAASVEKANGLSPQVGQLKATVEASSATITQQVQKLTDAIGQHDSLFQAAQAERTQAFQTAETARQSAFGSTQAEQNTQFTAAQSQRQDAFNGMASEQKQKFNQDQEERQRKHAEELAKHQEQFLSIQKDSRAAADALVAKYNETLSAHESSLGKKAEEIEFEQKRSVDELTVSYKDTANTIMDELLIKKKEIEDLIGVIGNKGVAHGYQEAANGARNGKFVWQAIAVLTILGLSCYTIFYLMPKSGDWKSDLSHVLYYAPLIVLAAYAGKQADKHEQSERKNRKMAIEMAAIGPFISPLNPDNQEEFRIKIGDRSFAQNDEPRHNVTDGSPTTVMDIAGLTKLIGLFKSIKN